MKLFQYDTKLVFAFSKKNKKKTTENKAKEFGVKHGHVSVLF